MPVRCLWSGIGRGYLDQIEWEFLVKSGTPRAYQPLHHPGVGAGTALVGFSLIPDASGNAVGHHGINHAVVQRACFSRKPRIGFIRIVAQDRVAHYAFAGRPCLGGGSAPCGYDDSYRHVQLFLDVAAEEVGQGTRAAHRFGRALCPLRETVFLRERGGYSGHVKIRRLGQWAFAVSSSPFFMPWLALHSILDCPLHSQTSPSMTSVKVTSDEPLKRIS